MDVVDIMLSAHDQIYTHMHGTHPSSVADPGFRKGRFHSNTNAQPGLTCMITLRTNFHNASYITSYVVHTCIY